MSFAIIHMQKIKTGGIRGIQNHNERLKESKTNPDIDLDQSYLNKELYEINNDKTYYTRVKERIKELNLPKAVRKDAVTMCGFICTSDNEFFNNLSRTDKEKFFNESYKFLKNRYGEKNVVAATVHYDEKTPHLHCYIVPVTIDGRLSAKDVFNKLELKRLQTDYPMYMNSKGFNLQRGLSSENKKRHLDTQEFKIQTKQKELEKAKSRLNKEIMTLKNDFKAIKCVGKDLVNINKIQAKKSIVSSKIIISEHDYDVIMKMAKKSVVLDDEYTKLKNELKWLQQDHKCISKNLKNIEGENCKLKLNNSTLKSNLKKLLEQAMAMKDVLLEHNLLSEANEIFKDRRAAERISKKVLKNSSEFEK